MYICCIRCNHWNWDRRHNAIVIKVNVFCPRRSSGCSIFCWHLSCNVWISLPNEIIIIITYSLGPVKLVCCIEMLLYPRCKNNKIQRNFELWDQESYFVISGFCYISVLYNESPLYINIFSFWHLPLWIFMSNMYTAHIMFCHGHTFTCICPILKGHTKRQFLPTKKSGT